MRGDITMDFSNFTLVICNTIVFLLHNYIDIRLDLTKQNLDKITKHI